MARRRHTGILNTNFPSTPEEMFHVSQCEAKPNFMAEVEACKMRALAAKRRELREKPRPPSRRQTAHSVFVEVDSLKRPITYPRSREAHRQEREEFLTRYLPKKLRQKALENPIGFLTRALSRKARKEAREKPVLLDIHEQFRTVELFYRNRRDLEDARKWIAEDDHRRSLTTKFGAGNPEAERVLQQHRERFPDLREALERYEMRSADEEKSLVTREQAESLSDPVLKRELLDYLESTAEDDASDRKRAEAMKEIEYRSHNEETLFGKIKELDQRISVRPFEPKARIRNKKITQLKGGLREKLRGTKGRKHKHEFLAIIKAIRLQDRGSGKPRRPQSEVIRIARKEFAIRHPELVGLDKRDTTKTKVWPAEKTAHAWILKARRKRRASTKQK
jgi:hypothetical protein